MIKHKILQAVCVPLSRQMGSCKKCGERFKVKKNMGQAAVGRAAKEEHQEMNGS